MKQILYLSAVLIATSLISGCDGYTSPEELDRLVKEDQAFAQMIAARDKVHQEIHLVKADLLAKKKALDVQTARLREQYDGYAKAQNMRIEKLKSAIEANRDLLRRQVESESTQLAAKSTELEGYRKTLEDVKKVLTEGKGIRLSSAEKQKWEERVLMLSEKMRPLSEEIQELKLKIRLKKQKAKFLE